MKPTRAGWALITASIAALAAGRLLTVQELTAIGTTGLILVCLAALGTISTADLRIERTIIPRRPHVGTPVRVQLTIENTGSRRTPILRARETVPGTGGADLWIAPLRPDEPRRAGYRLPTPHRGPVPVGPLVLHRSDPLGLVSRSWTTLPSESLLVLPRIEAVGPVDAFAALITASDREAPGAHRAADTSDFSHLRPYAVGDDLRRIHWSSTARTGELQVRQMEEASDRVLTIFVDARRSRGDEVTFERIVSIAAGLVETATRIGARCRLVISDGTDTGSLPATAGRTTLLETLARLDRHDDDRLPGHLDVTVGAGLVLTGSAPPRDATRFEPWDDRYPIFVCNSASPVPDTPGRSVIVVPDGRTLVDAWTDHRRASA